MYAQVDQFAADKALNAVAEEGMAPLTCLAIFGPAESLRNGS
jgi:hypothetical protein